MAQAMRELAPQTRGGGGAFQEWKVILVDDIGEVNAHKAADDTDEQGVQVVFVCAKPATKGGGAEENKEPQRENEVLRPVLCYEFFFPALYCFVY